MKIGNKLFDSGDDSDNYQSKVLNLKDPKLARAILEQESPELKMLLTELKDTLREANGKLKPTLQQIKQGKIECPATLTSYMEMKYNLMMSYCTYLSFYLLMKLDGKSVQQHPVLFKLTNIKNLLD